MSLCCVLWHLSTQLCYMLWYISCTLWTKWLLTRCLLMKCHGSILFFYYFLAFFLVLMFKIKQFSTFQRYNIKLDHLSANKKVCLIQIQPILELKTLPNFLFLPRVCPSILISHFEGIAQTTNQYYKTFDEEAK